MKPKIKHSTCTAFLLFATLSATHAQESDNDEKDGKPAGAVFAMTNRAAANEVVAFTRGKNGKIKQDAVYETRGSGQGVDFDTQGGLTLSPDHHYLYACNPGSDNVTVFEVDGAELKFMEKVEVGDQPTSITLSGNFAYVLNSSVAGNGITGFRVDGDGRLKKLKDSFRDLSSPIAVPGEVRFSPNGRFLVVTHKVGSMLDVFQVSTNGTASQAAGYPSSGPRPFALNFKSDGRMLVIESGLPTMGNAGVSTYNMDAATGTLTPITSSAKNTQTDGCWIVITNNQQYAYAANFINGTISSYSLGADGSAALLEIAAGNTGPDSNVTDLAFSADTRYLYNLLRGAGGVAAYRVEANGGLTSLGIAGMGRDLKASNGPSGLAAY